ncbi:class I SAM-dependent methyltransferase [Microbaculum sp. FT89]|uniref:class I SAM-dependent methyltransferase n=1 Tax=Microbaculum sp. FT89 TaxID=3447298 RepID=UPI003F537882
MASETLDRHPGDTRPDEDRAPETAAADVVRADADAAPEQSPAKPTRTSSTRGETAPKKTAAKRAAPKKAAPKKATPKKAASRKAAAKTSDGEPEGAKSASPKSGTESATRKPVAKRSRAKTAQAKTAKAKPAPAKPAKAEVSGATATPAETPDQAADAAQEKAPKTVRKRKATTRKRAAPAKTTRKTAEDAASKDKAETPAEPSAPAVAKSKPPAPPPPARSEPPTPEIREQTPLPAPQGIDAPPLSPYRAALRHLHRLLLDRSGNTLDKADTAVETPLRDLHVVGPNAAHGNDYRPTPRRLVEWVLSGVQECLPDPLEHTTFLDIGSGRGRVLFEAARFPFQHIVGVEFARELHEDAELNLRHWPRAHMRCREVDLILDDAFDAPLPEGDLVVWMFDPFSERLMTRMAARLAEHARTARVTLVLVDPRNPMAFRESPTFKALELPPSSHRRIALLSPYPVRIYTATPR